MGEVVEVAWNLQDFIYGIEGVGQLEEMDILCGEDISGGEIDGICGCVFDGYWEVDGLIVPLCDLKDGFVCEIDYHFIESFLCDIIGYDV